jgi:hypothetical protein
MHISMSFSKLKYDNIIKNSLFGYLYIYIYWHLKYSYIEVIESEYVLLQVGIIDDRFQLIFQLIKNRISINRAVILDRFLPVQNKSPQIT